MQPFWKRKRLEEMTAREWETLCDGCGRCCLERVQDSGTGAVRETSVACQYLHIPDCRCMVYRDRTRINPECVRLQPGDIHQLMWLPSTCAYRTVAEGRDLEWWHPLVSGDPETVHQALISVRERAISGRHVHPRDIS